MALRYSHKLTLTDGATITIDHSLGYDQYKVTLGGNRTLSLTNFNDTDTLLLIVEQDATGGRTLTLDGVAIPLHDGAGEKTLVAIVRDGLDNLVDTNVQGTATADTTAPTVVSATAVTANTIKVVFDEIVTATNVGWSFKQNGTPITPDSISGSGTNTLTFTFSETIVISDTLLRTYDSATGDTADAASNELVSFTDQAVTNSVDGYVYDSTYSYNFNSDAAVIEFADGPAFQFSTGIGGVDSPFSICFWGKLATGQELSVGLTADGNVFGQRFRVAEGEAIDMGLVLRSDASNYFIRQNTEAIPTDVWHFFSLTYDGTKVAAGIKMYRNAVDKAHTLGPAAGTYTGCAATGTLRAGQSSTTVFDRGLMHGLFYVDRVLTPTEITEAYNSGVPIDIRASSFASDVIAYYLFANNLNDSSTGGTHDGTATTPAYSTDAP